GHGRGVLHVGSGGRGQRSAGRRAGRRLRARRRRSRTGAEQARVDRSRLLADEALTRTAGKATQALEIALQKVLLVIGEAGQVGFGQVVVRGQALGIRHGGQALERDAGLDDRDRRGRGRPHGGVRDTGYRRSLERILDTLRHARGTSLDVVGDLGVQRAALFVGQPLLVPNVLNQVGDRLLDLGVIGELVAWPLFALDLGQG